MGQTTPYTKTEKELMGKKIADLLMLQKDRRTNKYKTLWGEKTAEGIFETVTGVADDPRIVLWLV